MALIERDPVSLEIMWARLVTVVEEMWHTIVRTAFSLIVSEAQDFATDLLDPYGESLAHSPRAMPVFNLTVPIAVKAILAKYPPHTLRDGDVLITNDPWLCAGHLLDIAVVTPVFRGGVLVALTATVGHVGDIGGTKDSLRAREIYDEGFQIPPMYLYRAGVANDDLFTLLGENVRKPEEVLGDVHSFVAANRLGADRLVAFMADYGMHDLRALAAVVQNRSEAAVREAIAALPEGVYRSEISNNPLGTRLTYPLAVTVQRDTIELDFAGAPPQQALGGLNCTWSYAAAHATYPLKCILSPGVRSNAGCYRPFAVKLPPHSILNCDRPASVNLRTRTGWYIAPNIFRALSQAAPDQVQAATGLPHAVNIYGRDGDGTLYADHFFMGGGQGACSRADGKSALLYPTSAANTSVELMETRAPVLVLEKSFVPDSGGPGRFRGGLGVRTRLLAQAARRRTADAVLGLSGRRRHQQRRPVRRWCGRRRPWPGARRRGERGAGLRDRRAGDAHRHRPGGRGPTRRRLRFRRPSRPGARRCGPGRGGWCGDPRGRRAGLPGFGAGRRIALIRQGYGCVIPAY